MNITLRSKASSFLLAIIGTALSGTIAAFIIIMIYANFQLAAAGTLGPVEDCICPRPSTDRKGPLPLPIGAQPHPWRSR